jgi:hypothetical protein
MKRDLGRELLGLLLVHEPWAQHGAEVKAIIRPIKSLVSVTHP